jgi:enamine deaminase RidA (YjgF/YER057c/UK114 family)
VVRRLRRLRRLQLLTTGQNNRQRPAKIIVAAQLAAFREIKDRYIKENAPAWTILGVAALARPTLFVEIKAVAAMRSV